MKRDVVSDPGFGDEIRTQMNWAPQVVWECLCGYEEVALKFLPTNEKGERINVRPGDAVLYRRCGNCGRVISTEMSIVVGAFVELSDSEQVVLPVRTVIGKSQR